MHSKLDNIEIIISDEVDEVIKELFNSLKNRYQNNLESMKDSEFVFNYVWCLYYKCHKINPNCGGLYIDSPHCIKSKASTINPINKKYNKCFQCALTVSLNYDEIKIGSQGITKIKPFIDKQNWKGINFPSEKDDWKKFERNNVTLLLMFCMLRKKYISKHKFQNITQTVKNMLLF